jgi:uncharacterized membrane protein YqjE
VITELKDDADQSIRSLVGEIASDAQRLVKQHLELFRHELREDVRNIKQAGLVITAALVLASMGCFLMAVTAVGLLSWAVPAIPWWGWCGILGAVTLLAAIVAYKGAMRMMTSMNLLPVQTARIIKEDLQWTTNEPTR